MITALLAQLNPRATGIGTYRPPADVYQPGNTSATAGQTLNFFISNMVGFLTILGGITFMLYFFFGALQWVLAGSDDGKVETAKKQMTNGAIGLIIIILSYGIIAAIGRIVGLDILDPGSLIQSLNPVGGVLAPVPTP